jgi:hypothetical protein
LFNKIGYALGQAGIQCQRVVTLAWFLLTEFDSSFEIAETQKMRH